MRSGVVAARALVFVGVFAAYFLLRRLSLEPDGLAYLHYVDVPRHVDLVHLLYVPTLRLLGALLPGPLPLAALAFSACCGAVYVVAFWRLLETLDLRPAPALAAALVVGLSPPFLSSAVTVEVYTPAHGSLVLALLFAAEFGRTGRRSRLPWIALFGALAVGYHAFTIFGLPAALWLMGLTGRGIRLRYLLLVPVIVAVPASILWVLDVEWINIRSYFEFAKGFLPDPEAWSDPAATLTRNATAARQFLGTTPPVLLLSVPALICGFGRHRKACTLSLVWALPFLLVFLAVRVSYSGLLLPAIGGLAVALAPGAQSILDQGGRTARAVCVAILVGSLVWTGARSIPPAYEASRTMDPYEAMARRIIDRVPPDVSVFANGRVALFLELASDVRFVSLEVVNRTLPKGKKGELIEEVARLAAAEAAEGFRPHLSTDGVLFLQRTGFDTVGTLLAQGEKIDLTVHEDEEYLLHPLVTTGRPSPKPAEGGDATSAPDGG